MSTHMFIGAGPANLDRALRILESDPDATLVFIDKRIHPDGSFNTLDLRKNTLLLSESFIKDLLSLGVDQSFLDTIVVQRKISEQSGFQKLDLGILPQELTYQVTIGDYQIALIKALQQRAKVGTLRFINKEVESDCLKDLVQIGQNSIPAVEKIRAIVGFNREGNQDEGGHIHIADGALTTQSAQQGILYPSSGRKYGSKLSPELKQMSVTPTHGTVTFTYPTGEFLPEDILPMEQTNWKDCLRPFGWNLLRPPSVRFFYTKGGAYIGTEIPYAWKTIYEDDKQRYQNSLITWGRVIAQLMVPSFKEKIALWEPNTKGVNAPSFFETNRGESGTTIAQSHKNWVTFIHGDARYLPHYQTASGLTIAAVQNKLYVELFKLKTFDELIRWGRKKRYINLPLFVDETEVHEEIKRRYSSMQEDEIVPFLRMELLTFAIRDAIDENKLKVWKYFRELNLQAFDGLTDKIFFTYFSAYFDNPPELLAQIASMDEHVSDIPQILKRMVMINIIKTCDNDLLRSFLPRAVNIDGDNLHELECIRDAFFRQNIEDLNDVGWYNTLISKKTFNIIFKRYPSLKEPVLRVLLAKNFYQQYPITLPQLKDLFNLYGSIGNAEEFLENQVINNDKAQIDLSRFNDFKEFYEKTYYQKKVLEWIISKFKLSNKLLLSKDELLYLISQSLRHCMLNNLVHFFLSKKSLIISLGIPLIGEKEFLDIYSDMELTRILSVILNYKYGNTSFAYYFNLIMNHLEEPTKDKFLSQIFKSDYLNTIITAPDLYNKFLINTENLELICAIFVATRNSVNDHNIFYSNFASTLNRLRALLPDKEDEVAARMLSMMGYNFSSQNYIPNFDILCRYLELCKNNKSLIDWLVLVLLGDNIVLPSYINSFERLNHLIITASNKSLILVGLLNSKDLCVLFSKSPIDLPQTLKLFETEEQIMAFMAKDRVQLSSRPKF